MLQFSRTVSVIGVEFKVYDDKNCGDNNNIINMHNSISRAWSSHVTNLGGGLHFACIASLNCSSVALVCSKRRR